VADEERVEIALSLSFCDIAGTRVHIGKSNTRYTGRDFSSCFSSTVNLVAVRSGRREASSTQRPGRGGQSGLPSAQRRDAKTADADADAEGV
jgi:hypothetical protein